MTTQQKGIIKLELPSSSIPGSGPVVQSTQAHLVGRRVLTEEEQYVQDKLRTDLAIQLGAATKSDFAQQLTHALTIRTERRFVEFVDNERTILEMKRHVDDQADIEAFFRRTRQDYANDQIEIREAGIGQVKGTVATSLAPPEKKKDEIIVERAPGLLGWLGGQQVTKVRR